MFGLIFHHDEFATLLNKHLDKDMLTRAHRCAIKVTLDIQQDAKYPWLFQGLSVQRVNYIMKVFSCMREQTYRDKNEEELKLFFTPYDAMPFKTDTEDDLFVAYSIKDIRSQFRQLMIGPEFVSLYEKDIPHFGPIYVFRARMEYTDNEDPVYHMLEIQSSVDEILSVLERLNFGA